MIGLPFPVLEFPPTTASLLQMSIGWSSGQVVCVNKLAGNCDRQMGVDVKKEGSQD